MYNHSVLASTRNHDQVVGHFNQTSLNDESIHRAVNVSTVNHNSEHNLNSSKSRTTHVTQPASMMTLLIQVKACLTLLLWLELSLLSLV